MPWKPKHPCSYPGCIALAESGQSRCRAHTLVLKAQQDAQRGTSTQRGYNTRWRRLRKWFLNAHPLCAECQRQKKLTHATLVDHIIPHRGDSALLYDPTNLQSLCTLCHNRKTVLEDGGLGRARKTT